MLIRADDGAPPTCKKDARVRLKRSSLEGTYRFARTRPGASKKCFVLLNLPQHVWFPLPEDGASGHVRQPQSPSPTLLRERPTIHFHEVEATRTYAEPADTRAGRYLSSRITISAVSPVFSSSPITIDLTTAGGVFTGFFYDLRSKCNGKSLHYMLFSRSSVNVAVIWANHVRRGSKSNNHTE